MFDSMSERAGACKRKAAECERAEKLAKDEHARLLYLDLANEWQRRPSTAKQTRLPSYMVCWCEIVAQRFTSAPRFGATTDGGA